MEVNHEETLAIQVKFKYNNHTSSKKEI